MKKFLWNEVDTYDNFADFCTGMNQKFGPKPAVSYFDRRGDEICYTYQEMTDQAAGLRETLIHRGLSGRHIAIVGENSYEWIVAYLAITSCGGTAVCIDAEQSDEAIREMVANADSQAVFAARTYAPICRPLLDDKKISFLFSLEKEKDEDEFSFQSLCQEGEERIKTKGITPCKVGPDQTAVIVYTSGTTSISKPVMLSQKAVLHNASNAVRYVSTEEKVYTSLPFYHTYGMTSAVLTTLVHGTHLYINGNLKTAMRDLHLAQPDSMLTVPLMVEAIHNQIWLNAEKEGKAEDLRRLFKWRASLKRLRIPGKSKILEELRRKALGNLHIIISGGAHLSKAIAEEFQAMGVLVLEGYGITECAPMVAVNSNRSYNLESVGYVLPGTEVKIVEEEIWVRGESVMKGYYKREDLTAEALEDGWFKTGDLGYLDRNGFLFITGRKKNLIVFKNGKKISPEKLEELIRAIPLVKDVVVYGAANGTSADDVTLAASIYPDPARSEGMSSYEILEHLQREINQINAALPLYQQIQLVNIREQEFSKTASQKIKRHMV